MTRTIDQDIEEAKLTWEATNSLAIVSIFVAKSSFQKSYLGAGEADQLFVEETFAPAGFGALASEVKFLTDFEFKIYISPKTPESIPLAAVSVTFESNYLREAGKLDDKHFVAFHQSSVIFAAWPFFREYIQSSVTRMGLPPPPVRFLAIRVRPSTSPKPESQPAPRTSKRGTRSAKRPIAAH